MTVYRVPFGSTHDSDDPPATFQPGAALALAAASLDQRGAEPGEQWTLEAPWGPVLAERRGSDQLVVALPRVEVTAARVLTTVAALRMGLDRKRVEATEMPIQELDVGTRVLVVPLDDPKAVEAAESQGDPAEVPDVEAAGAIVYTRTQRTPYVKVLGRLVGQAEPLTALSAAAVHLVRNLGVRATYPRTRVVGELVGHPEANLEITVQAEKAGHEPKIQRVWVGGRVRRV